MHLVILSILLLSQTIREVEDKTANCTNYPNPEYKSFAECDQDSVRKYLPKDLVPFWVTSNLSEATKFWRNNNSNINSKTLYFKMGKLK